MRAADPFYDWGWSPVSGCKALSPGCLNCYAPGYVPLQKSRQNSLYAGITEWRFGRQQFNGHLKFLLPEHPLWRFPREWPGARVPVMGPGKPSIIFACHMCDLFVEHRPIDVIDRVVSRIALSDHIGLLLTKYAQRMSAYFIDERTRAIQRLGQNHLWLGFSAERQKEFDQRWYHMRKLASRGWFVFVSIAPMLEPVKLPPDFLAYGHRTWVLCYGEQGSGWRYANPDWMRAIKKQCREAGIPLFVKQMSGKRPIPYDLRIKQFPRTSSALGRGT